jgi:galactose mutarotase-like enzyme
LIDSEQVDEEEARNYAQTIDAHFFVVSAKDLYTVNEMFKDIAKIYSGAKNVSIEDTNEENYFQIQKIRKDSVKVTLKKPEKKKKCC